ncbi:MAG: hypothetical protein EPGJADBJ_00857 [Saprospiraceae bacterium]|nr:hypothetical protein [Saprospiraceae bacterium]
MAITYREIRNDRQWKASTGLSEEQFFRLEKLFGQAYEILFGESMEARQSNSSGTSTFKTYADLLFFTLYSVKSGLTYDLLGLTFGLDGANAYQNQALGLRVLRAALEHGGYLPKRSYQSIEEFKEHWSEESEILLDATEQGRQRPGNQEDQKKDYSGKKKGTR